MKRLDGILDICAVINVTLGLVILILALFSHIAGALGKGTGIEETPYLLTAIAFFCASIAMTVLRK